METECRGCGVLQKFDRCNVQIDLPKTYDQCPCRKCIVKGMCEIMCDEYKELWPTSKGGES